MNRTYVSLGLVLLVAGVTVAATAAGPVTAPTVTDDSLRYNTPDDIVSVGADQTPTWIVTTNDQSALQSWADDSSARTYVRDLDQNRTVIAAGQQDIGAGLIASLTDNGLAYESYVTSVRPNRELALSEPVPDSAKATAENYTAPDQYSRLRNFGAEYPDDGIAHRGDENVTTLAEARTVIGADNVTETGSGLTVAVIDTGANTANGTLGLEGNIMSASTDYVDSNSTYTETVGNSGIDAVEDENGHGSWVTASIAADPDNTVSDETYEGVAPGADLLVMRALDEDGSGSTADIAQAVRDSEANGADVISMSLGSQLYTQEVAQAIADACRGNTTAVVIAAGNSRRAGAPYLASPADVPEDCVIAVAASNTTAASDAGVAAFSQVGSDPGADGSDGQTRGEDVDVTAPGIKIEAQVATTTGGTDTESLSGTSMAQPLAAGATLQTLEARVDLVNDSEATHAAMTDTAVAMPSAAAVEAGHGMVNSERAIADNTTGEDQTDAMTDAAQTRDEFWRSASLERAQGFFEGLF